MRPAVFEPADEVIAQSGVAFQLWWLYQHSWLVCLLFPLISLVSEPFVPWRLALGVLALLFFAISSNWIMWPHPVNQETRARARSRLAFLPFVVLSLQVIVFSLVDGPAWLWLFIGVNAIADVLLPMRATGIVVMVFTLLPLVITISTHGGFAETDWWWLIALMLLVRGLDLDMTGVTRLGSAIRELHTKRRELARLKVEEERLRLARDLHDLLGHTLSMITLKSELARLLVTEENEWDAARQLLEAARIDARLELSAKVFPPAIDAVLAWTVREGVTNVIRHSRARYCLIRLAQENGRACAEVLDDGGTRLRTESATGQGSGLAGLRERVSALRGQMEVGPLTLSGTDHFRLYVALPMCSRVGAQTG